MTRKRELLIERLSEFATLPRYAHPGDAGMDLCSTEDLIIAPGARALVKTGLRIQLPSRTEAQIRSRSGLALKDGISVLNSPGTIDEGYRGEIAVILINFGDKPFHVKPQMRIAQMVIHNVEKVSIRESRRLSTTARSRAGFGSTGI